LRAIAVSEPFTASAIANASAARLLNVGIAGGALGTNMELGVIDILQRLTCTQGHDNIDGEPDAVLVTCAD
jgi:hypothetical protein